MGEKGLPGSEMLSPPNHPVSPANPLQVQEVVRDDETTEALHLC